MTFFLTHIPKTAGTSLRKAVFDAHLDSKQIHRFIGVRDALRSKADFDLLKGHYPYGIHWLYRIRSPRYFVMLRDPVDPGAHEPILSLVEEKASTRPSLHALEHI